MYLFFLQIRKNKQGTGPAPETAHLSPSRIWPPVLQRKKRLDPSRKGFFFIYLFIYLFFYHEVESGLQYFNEKRGSTQVKKVLPCLGFRFGLGFRF